MNQNIYLCNTVNLTNQQTAFNDLYVGNVMQYCGWGEGSFFARIFNSDFDEKAQNPIYLAEAYHYQVYMIIYTLCYAYSILRFLMFSVVITYQMLKLNEQNKTQIKSLIAEKQEFINQKLEKYKQKKKLNNPDSENLPEHQILNPKEEAYQKKKFSQDYDEEHPMLYDIQVYKFFIYFLSFFLEPLITIRDFFWFRALILYSTSLHSLIPCYYKLETINPHLSSQTLICPTDESWKSQENILLFNDAVCNCLYWPPSQYMTNSQPLLEPKYSELDPNIVPIGDTSFMLFTINFWIATEALLTGGLIFIVLTLSRINRRDLHARNFVLPNIIISCVATILIALLFWILIFQFDFMLYFRYRDPKAMKFYVFWKALGLMLLYDKYYSKIWLGERLSFPNLHQHNFEWKHEINQVKQRLVDKFQQRLEQAYDDEQQNFNQQEKNNILIFLRDEEKKRIIHQQYSYELQNYYKRHIEKTVKKYDKNSKKRLLIRWNDYLIFLLVLSSIGLLGFVLMTIFEIFRNSGPINPQPIQVNYLKNSEFDIQGTYLEWLYWIGFILALIESVVFEIANGIYLFHSFFLELSKHHLANNSDTQSYSAVCRSDKRSVGTKSHVFDSFSEQRQTLYQYNEQLNDSERYRNMQRNNLQQSPSELRQLEIEKN